MLQSCDSHDVSKLKLDSMDVIGTTFDLDFNPPEIKYLTGKTVEEKIFALFSCNNCTLCVNSYLCTDEIMIKLNFKKKQQQRNKTWHCVWLNKNRQNSICDKSIFSFVIVYNSLK